MIIDKNFLPSTLLPKYHDLQLGDISIVGAALAVTAFDHSRCASCVHSILLTWLDSIVPIKVAMKLTCCSMEQIILLSTLGEPGPVTVNKFGKSAIWRPK